MKKNEIGEQNFFRQMWRNERTSRWTLVSQSMVNALLLKTKRKAINSMNTFDEIELVWY